MQVSRILEDDWHGVSSADQERPCSSVQDAVSSVSRLNGRNRTLVELICDENRSLTIGGGNDGRFVCFATVDKKAVSLVDRSQPAGEVTIVAGGQQGLYQRAQCLSLDTVVKAR